MRYLLITLLVAGCTHTTTASEHIIAEEITETLTTPIPETKTVEEMSTKDLMIHGQAAYYAKNFPMVVAMYSQALKKGELNDMGKIMAYWSLGVANDKMGKYQQAATYFWDFAETGKYMLDNINDYNELAKDFAKNFVLADRVREAQVYLEHAWAPNG